MYFGPGDWVNQPDLIERNNGHTYITITKEKVRFVTRTKIMQLNRVDCRDIAI